MKKLLAILLSVLFILGTFAVVNATEYFYDGSKDIPGYLNFYIDSDMVESAVITDLDLVINWKLRPNSEDTSGLLGYNSFIESASFKSEDKYENGVLKFSFSDKNGVDLSCSKTFLTLTFSRNKYFMFSHDDIVDFYVDGNFTDINGNDYSKRNVIKTELDAEYDIRETDAMLEGHMSVNNIGITEATEPTVTEPTFETQMTEPASSETQSTSNPAVYITLTAQKTKIYVGETTTVYWSVSDENMTSGFKLTSSDTKVATVSSDTGKVKGVGEGTAVITASVSGSTKSLKITVAKRVNPMKVTTAVKAVKYSTVKKKAITVKPITVSKAQGKVTYKKLSGNKKITVNTKTGKFTVKKGTKKSTYTIKVKVTAAGNTTYKSGGKTVTVKIKVK